MYFDVQFEVLRILSVDKNKKEGVELYLKEKYCRFNEGLK